MRHAPWPAWMALPLLAFLLISPATAQAAITSDDLVRVLTLRDYSTRVVVAGVALLGLAAGVIGVFALLRKRSLMADAVAHATLPGIAIAFMLAVAVGGTGRSMPVLLAGAAVAGLIGMGSVLLIRHSSRIKDDAALGIVLSVFFGIGVALLGIVQQMRGANAAGLDRFLLGNAAALSAADAWTILIIAALIALLCLLLYKEFTLLCFDSQYAAAGGMRVLALDATMMSMVVAVTVIGLQAVGLVLVVGLLIIPPAAARFWTDRLLPMVVAAAAIGAVSGMLGALVSATFPRTPTGPVIVLVCAGCFAFSMLVGPRRGVIAQLVRHRRLSRRTALQHLLRDLYEYLDRTAEAPPLGRATDGGAPPAAVPLDHLLARRSWSRFTFRRLLREARRRGYVSIDEDAHTAALTEAGLEEAARVVRNHRLWEQFLVRYADIAPSHVDRDADDIEHVLGEPMVRELEQVLEAEGAMPASPHVLK